MSKKKPNRFAIKQKRRIKRKCQKRRLARTASAKSNASDGNNVLTFWNNKQLQQDEVNVSKNLEINFQTDQEPSTSRDCPKRTSPTKNINKKRSPWKNAGGKVNKFKKIIDDQARKLVQRSANLINNNQTSRKCSPRSKITKRYFNSSRSIRKIRFTTFGDIHTDDESVTISNFENKEDDEDDCIVIEPNVDKIIIEDDNDDDILPSCRDVSSNYQPLVHSFKERVSSISCHKNSENSGKSPSPFFVDICGSRNGLESINCPDDYSKLSILDDKTIFKHRTVRLKENSSSEIIDLDNSECKDQSSNLEGEFCEEDDSVIFVGETNKNDFIPIEDDTIPPNKILKITETHNTPVNRQRINTNSLFTVSETKKLNKYNENAYNPSGDKTLTNSKRMVIIDGSNVAFKHGLDQAFSVKGLKIAIEYFEKLGHEVKAVIPQFRMNNSKSTDPGELSRLHKAGKIVQTPCKNLPGLTSISYDDRFILQLTFELDAVIVSNDNYRDLLDENPAFKKIIENRVIGYTWCNDIFILPKDPYGKWGPTLHKILNR